MIVSLFVYNKKGKLYEVPVAFHYTPWKLKIIKYVLYIFSEEV